MHWMGYAEIPSSQSTIITFTKYCSFLNVFDTIHRHILVHFRGQTEKTFLVKPIPGTEKLITHTTYTFHSVTSSTGWKGEIWKLREVPWGKGSYCSLTIKFRAWGSPTSFTFTNPQSVFGWSPLWPLSFKPATLSSGAKRDGSSILGVSHGQLP